MATIKEVADRAGVSVATVSRVINRTGYVSGALQERVRSAMETLNYQPSALARGLRRQETQTIGLLVPQLDQDFFSALAFAIEKTLFSQGYHVFICSPEEDSRREDAYIDMLLRQRVDGVILVPTDQSGDNIRRLVDKDVPVVLVDRDLRDLAINRVLCDNVHGGYIGARHLLELGHVHIGVIVPHAAAEPIAERVQGIRQAFADCQAECQPNILFHDKLGGFEMGYESARTLLTQKPRPTAIFALTDMMAIGVLHAAAELGLALPDDLSVMGFDGIPLAAYTIPELTTVAQPIYELGEMAASILLRHILQSDAPLETQRLETRLVVRKSTAPTKR